MLIDLPEYSTTAHLARLRLSARKWTGAEDPPTRRLSRRDFLRRIGLLGLLTAGIGTLEFFGGSLPAHATLPSGATCSTSGLVYRSDNVCVPSGYSTSCGIGCNPTDRTISSGYCRYSSFYSRHRTCGEYVQTGGVQYRHHAIRPNLCGAYSGGNYDGWKWTGVDGGSSCGCANERQFSCTDGWVGYAESTNYNLVSSWAKSICQKYQCIP